RGGLGGIDGGIAAVGHIGAAGRPAVVVRTGPAAAVSAFAALAALTAGTAIAAVCAGTAVAAAAAAALVGLILGVGGGGVDDHMAVLPLPLALAAHALHLADGRVDDPALVGVHGFHGKAAAAAAHLLADLLGQGGQVVLTLAAVAGHIQAQLDVIAVHPVGHQAGQIGKALHRLA